jgi:hypothetical protein
VSGAAGGSGYHPAPPDASAISLDAELKALIEILAENAHDAWAAARFADGWQYGPRHDTRARLHPNLVPYGDLSEAEKDIDRDVVVATVRGILAHGYKIRRSASH